MYYTRGKYEPKIGEVCELDSFEEIVKSQAYINSKKADNGLNDVAKELGVELESENKTSLKFQGIDVKYWEADIKTRIDELKCKVELEKLYRAKHVLHNNLSDDDKFQIEMAEISDGLSFIDKPSEDDFLDVDKLLD